MKPASFIRSIILFGIILISLMPQAWAQFPSFTTLAGKEQLNGGNVTRILQDNKGFIWLGTTQGLFIYDGFDFRQISFNDSLKESAITSLAINSTGEVWVGFSDGRIAFGHESGFSFFNPAEGLPGVAITAMLFDSDSTLWISTYGEGIYYYRSKRLFNINTDDGLADNFVYTLSRDKQGGVWAGSDAGLSLCDIRNNRKVLKHYSTSAGLPDIIVQKIIPAKSGGLWIGMQEKGVCFFNRETETFESVNFQNWDFGPVNDILDFGDLLWIATEGNGIIELTLRKEKKDRKFRFVEASGKRTGRLLHDYEGNVWAISSGSLLLTAGPGLRSYKTAGNLQLGNIHAVHAENDGSIWFGNDKGLFYYNPDKENNNIPRQFLPPQSKGGPGITSIYHDAQGNMWIGTFGNGLFRIGNGEKETKRISDPSGKLNDNILGISGKGKDVWFATLGGAVKCKSEPGSSGDYQFTRFSSAEGLGNNFIYTVLADKKGRIWFGTDGKGAAMFDKDRFKGFGPDDGLAGKVIYSITEDRDANIWFSSANEGVFRYSNGKFTAFTLSQGLRNLKITSLISSAGNQIVVVHSQGVDIINARTGQVSYLGMNAGISDINPDLNAVASDSSGSVWIGTRDGIIHYTPEYLNVLAMPLTSVRKVSVYLSGENAGPGEAFSHNQNHLSFEYIGLWYSNPEKVIYRVKLEGNDPDWIPTGDRRTTYSNLRPGKYTFRVQSSVNNDFTYASEASFSFSIKPPFYSRWWFILAVGLILAFSVYYISRTRLNRVRREQQLLKEKAESQFQLLRSQVNPHFLFNNFSTLMAIIEEDKELAIEYVGKLSAFFRYILEYRDKELIPLSEELEIVENYLFLQKKRYGSNLTVQKDINPEHLDSLIPPLTLQLLLENAVKHNIVSGAKPLNIRIYSEVDSLVIENVVQARKTREPSTGMGLQNIISRYRIFTSREISITQTTDLFKIALPLIITK